MLESGDHKTGEIESSRVKMDRYDPKSHNPIEGKNLRNRHGVAAYLGSSILAVASGATKPLFIRFRSSAHEGLVRTSLFLGRPRLLVSRQKFG